MSLGWGKDLTQETDKAICGVQWFLRGVALELALFNMCQAPTVYRGRSNLLHPEGIERKTISTLNNIHLLHTRHSLRAHCIPDSECPLYTRHSLSAHGIPGKLLSSFFFRS